MKKALLYQINYLIEIEEEEAGDYDAMESLDRLVGDKLPADHIILDDRHRADWESTREILLDPLKMNCGICARCHRWTTDMEKPDPVGELCNGATVEGELLCDECLPKGHPWAF